ncbi:diaminopimelate decarboxylase [Alicyclobacillus sp. SO9]|uniref:diaminopimelate decarboxylase n=1 Tax=Alicyclobacillus sp. SO9 TaxID=2665646 RepID=UPI001E517BC7|nr:diaminopimelate decarboxylase [Alicyclobacillus sp. SO9]
MQISEDGQLYIGGCSTTQLAQTYGTPLFVYDEDLLRANIQAFHKAFQQFDVDYSVAYASKAFCTKAIIQLVQEEGCALDVVSGGELYTALAAGMKPEHIHFHGNNKTRDELEYAVEQSIGTVVVDNFDELILLNNIAKAKAKAVRILLRISPGVEAHTHEYIATGQQDSKFGFDLESGQAHDAIVRLTELPHLQCIGLHAHIGSQIFDSRGFMEAVSRLGKLFDEAQRLGLDFPVMNLGGGFGIRYTDEDHPIPIVDMIRDTVQAVIQHFAEKGRPCPEIWVEPGRAIVGPAGATLYTVGSRKQISGIRNYVSVDGGMVDNPRLALYGARYEALLANRANDTDDGIWSVAGKSCESGDMLIWDIPLPHPQPNDILCVLSTGAYNYSMASHYNRIPHPAVVFVRDGKARKVVRRETWEDVTRFDCDCDDEPVSLAAVSASVNDEV